MIKKGMTQLGPKTIMMIVKVMIQIGAKKLLKSSRRRKI